MTDKDKLSELDSAARRYRNAAEENLRRAEFFSGKYDHRDYDGQAVAANRDMAETHLREARAIEARAAELRSAP